MPYTRAEYLELPEGYPAELIDGRLVKTPSPTWGHQRIVLEVSFALRLLLGPDRVVVSPIDVFVDDWNVLQPDVLVTACPLRRDAPNVGIPLLVAEVLSPSTASRDRNDKTGLYLGAGVREVWLVDPEDHSIEVHTARGSHRYNGTNAARSEVVERFVVVPLDLFGA